jgi:hypothetical protein
MLAAIASFAVYGVPLVGPHAVWLVGETLLRARRRPGFEPAWLAAEVGAAVGLQVVAGLVAYWVFRRPRSARPVIALLVAAPTIIAVTDWLFLIAIPTRFLVEPEAAAEHAAWPIECRVPDRMLFNGGVPGPVWAVDSRGERARLDGCRLEALPPIARDPGSTPVARATSGRLLVMRAARDGTAAWAWVDPGGVPVDLTPPATRWPSYSAPLLSRDGASVVWVVRDGDAQPPPQALLVRALSGGGERRVSLRGLPPGSVVPIGFDSPAGEITLAVSERTFVAVDLDGGVRWGPLRPMEVEPLSMTFRRIGAAGWVAWDGYRESDAYRLAWSLPAGRGLYRLPKGRSIIGVDVDSTGALIALSMTGIVSLGDIHDAVVVLRAADGAEVFRRFLPRYTRTAVAFLDAERFAYSDWVGQRAEVRVLRIAER